MLHVEAAGHLPPGQAGREALGDETASEDQAAQHKRREQVHRKSGVEQACYCEPVIRDEGASEPVLKEAVVAAEEGAWINGGSSPLVEALAMHPGH